MGLLYTKMKMFHFHEKIDSLPREGPILPPIHIRLKPTNACCHNCRYCAYRVKDLQLGQDMVVRDQIPREKMLEIVEDLGAMGVQAVTFSGGGEPFCYPHLLETSRGLAAAGIRFAALTNGSRLTGEVAEFFARRATWLRVSTDGWDGPSYAAYRGTSEAEYERVLANVRAFKAFGGPCYLGVSLIVDRDNASHVLEIIRTWRDVGADSIKVSPCIVSNSGRENNEYHRPFFNAVTEQIRQAQEELRGQPFEIYNAYHELADQFDKAYDWCPYVQMLTVIGADQNVYSCQDKAYNLESGLLGSIRDRRFRDFWFADKAVFFGIKPCMHCGHHCVAAAKNDLLLEYLNADKEHLGFV